MISLDEKEDPAIVGLRDFPKLKVDFSPFQSLDSFPVEALGNFTNIYQYIFAAHFKEIKIR